MTKLKIKFNLVIFKQYKDGKRVTILRQENGLLKHLRKYIAFIYKFKKDFPESFDIDIKDYETK